VRIAARRRAMRRTLPRMRSAPLLLVALALAAGACTPRRAPDGVATRATHRVGVHADVAPPGFPRPLVIAHRGASAHRPEHTLAAYALAIDMGADFIEPDLVRTRDGVLVARHENEIGGTTDVAARFPDRRTTRVVDGASVTGWFVEDFTLAELRTLRARERLPMRGHAHDGRHPIPTFDEVLALADSAGRARGRPVGVYPETKHPTHFRALGLPLEEPLVAALARRGWTGRDAPVFVQSFEPSSLRRVGALAAVRRIQLLSPVGAPPDGSPAWRELATPAGLARVRGWADGVGVERRMVLPVDSTGTLGAPTTLVADAHRAGLAVHVWTLRPEPDFLPRAYGGDARAEWRRLAALGVDGLFGDAPDDGVAALRPAGPPPAAGSAAAPAPRTPAVGPRGARP
jgi:glycerophosphoryl diester phosphodiesterase